MQNITNGMLFFARTGNQIEIFVIIWCKMNDRRRPMRVIEDEKRRNITNCISL